ncbi:MAG: DMT family transporter [Thaumarchaeota archaeon]|nr:DMT family transporter [Nitrososphaerota archaeon]
MINPIYALIPAFIWSFCPIYYRGFMKKLGFLSLNLVRTSLSAAVLLLPAVYFGFSGGLVYAILSGLVTLAVGDSLFLLSIRETGASVATPVVYSYVLLVQLTSFTLGQAVPGANIVASIMVVAGVAVLSRGGGGQPRTKGIAFALGAAVAWTAGQESIQLATGAGTNVFAIAFGRTAAAAVALGVVTLLTRKGQKWPSDLGGKEWGFVALIVISDLVVGSLFFVYSIALIGVALTVIITSLNPLLTQVFSRALGKEAPSGWDFTGGVLIVVAVIISISL